MAIEVSHPTVTVGTDAGNGEIRKAQWNELHTVAGAAGLGVHNRVINPAMKVDQRNEGAAQTFTAGGALAYCVDRWYGYCTGANVTGQRVALASGQNRYRFTGAASVTGVGFGQRIEASNSMDLAGTTATLSVKLKSTSLTSITWTAYYATTTDAFGTLASPTRTSIATGTFTITSTEATYSASMSVSSSAITGIEIVFTGGALLGTQTLDIGDVQLEPGGVVTDFYPRPYALERILCQRYYQKTYAEGTVPGTATRANMAHSMDVGGQVMTEVRWFATMRAAPTISYWDGNGNASKNSYYAGGAWTDNTNFISAFNQTSTELCLVFPNASLSTNVFWHFTVDAEL
jgi:hypothetical protein